MDLTSEEKYRKERRYTKLVNHLRLVLEHFQHKELKYRGIFYVNKALYFSDIFHMEKWGRLICDARTAEISWDYYNLKSGAFSNRLSYMVTGDIENFKIVNRRIVNLRACNKKHLSGSDEKAVIEAIKYLENSTIKEIVQASYYHDIPIGQKIDYWDIVEAMPNASDLIEYLNYD